MSLEIVYQPETSRHPSELALYIEQRANICSD